MSFALFTQAVSKALFGFLLVGALIFLPAGTLNYPYAWRLMIVLFVPMIIVGGFLMIRNPDQLQKRLDAQETIQKQAKLVRICGLMFALAYISAGFSFRANFMMLPNIVSIIASVLFLLGYVMYAETLRENAHLSRTVRLHKDQKLVDTGLYGVVRHPMYTATLILFLTMPLILGSVLSFLFFLVYPPVIVARIRSEEALLEQGLEGYSDYTRRVRYRLIPFIW